MTNLEKNILKELEHHNIKANIISIIMNKLNTLDNKNKFLSYMISNRNIKLSKYEIIDALKNII